MNFSNDRVCIGETCKNWFDAWNSGAPVIERISMWENFNVTKRDGIICTVLCIERLEKRAHSLIEVKWVREIKQHQQCYINGELIFLCRFLLFLLMCLKHSDHCVGLIEVAKAPAPCRAILKSFLVQKFQYSINCFIFPSHDVSYYHLVF